MKFPFVSRDRLEAVERQLQASEAERHLLMDRLALLRGEPALFSKPEPVPVPAAAEPEPIHVVTSPSKPAPKVLAGSVTFDHISRIAAEAVNTNSVGKTRIS